MDSSERERVGIFAGMYEIFRFSELINQKSHFLSYRGYLPQDAHQVFWISNFPFLLKFTVIILCNLLPIVFSSLNVTLVSTTKV